MYIFGGRRLQNPVLLDVFVTFFFERSIVPKHPTNLKKIQKKILEKTVTAI